MELDFLDFAPEWRRIKAIQCPSCMGRRLLPNIYNRKDFEEDMEICPKCSGLGYINAEQIKEAI